MFRSLAPVRSSVRLFLSCAITCVGFVHFSAIGSSAGLGGAAEPLQWEPRFEETGGYANATGPWPVLSSDGVGTWVATQFGDSTSRSDRDGATWTRPPGITAGFWWGGHPLAGAASGRWVGAFFLDDYGQEIHVAVSEDSGKSWGTPLTRLYPVPEFSAAGYSCDFCRIGAIALAEGEETFVMAWAVQHSLLPYNAASPRSTTSIFASRSRDGGNSWGKPALLSRYEGFPFTATIDVSFVADGRWLIGVHDDAVWTTTSDDDGATWTEQVFHSNDPEPGEIGRRLSAGCDPSGQCVMAYAGLRADQSDETLWAEHRDEIYVVRSPDGGKTWDDPRRLAQWSASGDESAINSLHPSIATDGQGHWGIAWTVGFPRDPATPREPWRLWEQRFELRFSQSFDSGETWTTAKDIRTADDAASRTVGQPALAYGGRGIWMLTVTDYVTAGDLDGYTTHVFVAGDQCGNGSLDQFEPCDDGNSIEGDGCEPNCTLTSECGDGVLSDGVLGDGEECDDGNTSNTDDCVSGCRLARCGDGYVHRGIEGCDDGNSSNEDRCLADCTWARCGDEYVDYSSEQCDDGNLSPNDNCAWCRLAYCGDGVVRAGVELCDDENDRDDDDCVGNCELPWCGDGFVHKEDERCDPADPHGVIPCNDECTIARFCGDPDFSGERTASDALHILNCAVEAVPPATCRVSACDLNGDLAVTASDARTTLGWAAGSIPPNADQLCAADSWLVVRLESTVELGALQLEISGVGAPIAFATETGKGDCQFLDPRVIAAGNAPFEQQLSLAMVSPIGFSGPTDVIRCRFGTWGPVALEDLPITIVDASGVDGTPVSPPQISIREEVFR